MIAFFIRILVSTPPGKDEASQPVENTGSQPPARAIASQCIVCSCMHACICVYILYIKFCLLVCVCAYVHACACMYVCVYTHV